MGEPIINSYGQGLDVSRPPTIPPIGVSDPIADMHARKLQRREKAVRAEGL